MVSRLLFKARRAVAMGYAQQFPTADERGRMSGEMVSAWRLTPETIERMSPSFVVPQPDMGLARSRGRFEFAYFAFTLPDGSGYGAIGAQFGPLCGHGGRYRIKIEDGMPQVEEEGIWIS